MIIRVDKKASAAQAFALAAMWGRASGKYIFVLDGRWMHQGGSYLLTDGDSFGYEVVFGVPGSKEEG